MATALEIANMALFECGADAISAFSDATEAARAVNTAWPFVRRSVLRMHPWNSPTKRVTLTADATAPNWEYAARYALPGDFVRLLEIEGDDSEDWRVENGFILTDAPSSIKIRYIYDTTSLSSDLGYDSLLTDALVLFLAYRVMNRLTADKAHRDRIERQWIEHLAVARQVDAQEQTDEEFIDDTWITARSQ